MRKITLSNIALLVAAGLILSACASKGASAILAGTSWKLVSYGPVENQIPAALGVETRVYFGIDGQVSGSVGCNQFSGNYEEIGGKITFSMLVSTMMACPELQMTQESTAFQVMSGTVDFELEGNTLTIFDASGETSIMLSAVDNK